MGKPWTDTEDAVVLAFYPAEAAKILGRSIKAVYHRRSLKDLGNHCVDRKPRNRLRREFFQRDSQGPREEAAPSRQRVTPKCRFCSGKAFARGLCSKCLDRAYWLIQEGYVPLWVSEQRWFAPAKYGYTDDIG
jgi:hypothetical protein